MCMYTGSSKLCRNAHAHIVHQWWLRPLVSPPNALWNETITAQLAEGGDLWWKGQYRWHDQIGSSDFSFKKVCHWVLLIVYIYVQYKIEYIIWFVQTLYIYILCMVVHLRGIVHNVDLFTIIIMAVFFYVHSGPGQLSGFSPNRQISSTSFITIELKPTLHSNKLTPSLAPPPWLWEKRLMSQNLTPNNDIKVTIIIVAECTSRSTCTCTLGCTYAVSQLSRIDI